MKAISAVTQVTAHLVKLPSPMDDVIAITANGEVPTTGWTAPRLSPRYYVRQPDDRIWDFDFIADEPHGIVGQVVLPISAQLVVHYPDWAVGVRVHAASNSLEAKFAPLTKVGLSPAQAAPSHERAKGHVIVRQTIAQFDDSIQPTGRTKWDPWPHAQMKKLHHELELVVEGPDEHRIRDCIAQATGAGLLAPIIAAFVTGGAALPAAISTFLGALEGCLGSSFHVTVENHSHWVYWWT